MIFQTLLYIAALSLILAGVGAYSGLKHQIEFRMVVALSVIATTGGLIGIFLSSWYIILATYLLLLAVYAIGLFRIQLAIYAYNTKGELLGYDNRVLEFQSLIKMIHDIVNEKNSNTLSFFERQLEMQTESFTNNDFDFTDYPSIKPDSCKYYQIALNHCVAYLEFFKTKGQIVHIGLMMFIPKKVDSDQADELWRLEKIFEVIKPIYGDPESTNESMMEFSNEQVTCQVIHKTDYTFSDELGRLALIAVKFFDKKFVNIQSET